MEERPRRVKAAFLAVREVPEPARHARLRELCLDDADLEREVLSLLEYDGQRGLDERPLDAASGALVRAAEIDLRGSRIGEFVLLRPIGKGGMGVVWEAEQYRPRRRVAVKILRRGITSREALRRFEHEVELLGRLQHPSIAQVYAAGKFEQDGEGVPWFAMELIEEALTLDDFVAAKELDLPGRLRLLAAVCDAVHHGHQRGVVHRDLKPSNVLVGPDGLPKVIDFGVARATDADVALTTQHTRAGELVGTLAYMSPEQCDADPGGLDSRSDVYSLGVMLYEQACRRPPYDLREKSITAAALIIREQEPEPPGRVDRRLRGDLEAIVLRCLEKDRQRRYASASEVAADLRRYLAGDPVEARRPGPWRRTARWIGRHPLATTALLCASVVTLSLGFLWLGSSLANTPARIEIQGQRAATLFSMSGNVLKRWEAPEGGWIQYAALVDRHERFGGGRVLALGLDFQPRSGELCLFEIADLESPYWTSASAPLELPRDERERAGTRFVVDNGILADVLPDVPGEEIVVTHRMVPYSAAALRVYDLAGTLYYEAWHDGGINGLYWLSGPKILIVAGLNSEKAWSALGVEIGDSKAVYPTVVFALKPERGRTHFADFVVHRGEKLDPTLLWYKWLGPAEHVAALDQVIPQLHANGGSWITEEYAQLDLRTSSSSNMQPPPDFSLILDGEGKEVGRIVSDGYWRWERPGRLPSASVYRLCDFAELPRP